MVRLRSPAPYSLGEFPSGQRGQTVNLLSLTSLVRIQLPPPNKNTDPCGRYFYLVRELGEQLRRQSRALCRIPPTAVSGVTRKCNKQSEQAVRPFQILPRVAIPSFPSDPCGRYFYLARCADSVRHLLCKCAGSHTPLGDRQARLSGEKREYLRIANTQLLFSSSSTATRSPFPYLVEGFLWSVFLFGEVC